RRLFYGLTLVMIWTIRTYAGDCTALVPPGGLYDSFRSWSSSDFQLAIDDYVYRKEYSTHDQALSDGLSLNTIVYGVPLQVRKTFSQSERDTWKEEYKKRTTLNKVIQNRDHFEQLLLNKEAIKLITNCIVETTAVGLRASFEMVDDCLFQYSVSYRGTKAA